MKRKDALLNNPVTERTIKLRKNCIMSSVEKQMIPLRNLHDGA